MDAQGQVCKSPNCGKPAKLQCPTCLKLKIEGSFFCSQECFKDNWVSASSKLVQQCQRVERIRLS